MELIFYYLIACISFSIMYYINYGREIISTVKELLDMFDIDYREEGTWSPLSYSISSLIMVALIMPWLLWLILTAARYDIIKEAAGGILEYHYGFEKEE